jgi:hypothetical protein
MLTDLLLLLLLPLLDQLLLLLSAPVLSVPVSLLLLLALPVLLREFEAAVVGASRWPFASISSPRMFVRRRRGCCGALLFGVRSTRRRGRCW